MFGTYDRAALQRGFQVYKEVCSACHRLQYLYFRDLADARLQRGPGQRHAAAWSQQVTDGPNDQGQMFQRPARPSDRIPGPFPNDQAARAANNGALPPDLSLIQGARGRRRLHLRDPERVQVQPPAGFKVMAGMYYNEYFPGHQIKMPPPLNPDQVTFADKHAGDGRRRWRTMSSTFLTWAAEPNLEQRHRIGFKVMLFLLVTTGVFYAAKRKIWSRIRHNSGYGPPSPARRRA